MNARGVDEVAAVSFKIECNITNRLFQNRQFKLSSWTVGHITQKLGVIYNLLKSKIVHNKIVEKYLEVVENLLKIKILMLCYLYLII